MKTALHQIQMIAGQLIRSGAEISEDNMLSIFNIEAIARTAGEDAEVVAIELAKEYETNEN